MTDAEAAPDSVRRVGVLEWSTPCGELFGALSKAQARLQTVSQDKSVDAGAYSYTYADLGSLLEVARAPLADNGLAILHGTATQDRGGQVVVTTALVHESGQWVASTLTARPTKDNIQGMGAAITYLRRYAVGAIVGIASEKDTDGDGADQGHRRTEQRQTDPVDALRKAWHARLGALVTAKLTPKLNDLERRGVQSHLWGVASTSDLDPVRADRERHNLRQCSDTTLAAIVKAVALDLGDCPHCSRES